MDITQYRALIQKLLTEYRQLGQPQTEDSADQGTDRLAFDLERDEYLWFQSGWRGKERVRHITMYLRIVNGKIWVEEDMTNLCVVDDLLAAGVPKQDIVLGFQHPSKRPLTEFATA
jgi:hypothetical protein